MNKDEVVTQVLPQFFPRHWLDNPGIVFTNFPSRIRIGYVFRKDGSYSYLMEPDLRSFNFRSKTCTQPHYAIFLNLDQQTSKSVKFQAARRAESARKTTTSELFGFCSPQFSGYSRTRSAASSFCPFRIVMIASVGAALKPQNANKRTSGKRSRISVTTSTILRLTF